MLEELALQYVNLPEHRITAVSYGLVVFGAIIASIAAENDAEVARAPYFAYSALIALLVSTAQFVWLHTIPAMIGGYLWILVAISLAASAIGGFFYGKIAIARSRDAYGYGRMAVLAFIPIANLWLLLKPSAKALSQNRIPTIALMTGRLGAVSGLALLMATVVVNVVIEMKAKDIVESSYTEPSAQQAGIGFLVKSKGLEEALRMMAADARTPIAVDDLTTLARIEADGAQLLRTYVVDAETASISEEFRVKSANGICANGPFISLLREGATIREVYVTSSGSSIGAVMVSREVCGF